MCYDEKEENSLPSNWWVVEEQGHLLLWSVEVSLLFYLKYVRIANNNKPKVIMSLKLKLLFPFFIYIFLSVLRGELLEKWRLFPFSFYIIYEWLLIVNQTTCMISLFVSEKWLTNRVLFRNFMKYCKNKR